MKNATKKLLKKLLSMALVLAATCTVTIFAAVSSYAAEDIIPVPDFPIIRAPYATDEIFDMDLAAIDALFPRELEIIYENGVISVKDFGAGIIEYNNGNIRTEMTLTDGYWTAEIGDRNNLPYEFFYVYSSDGVNTKQGRVWHVTYLYGERDPYIVLTDYDQNVDLTVAYDYEYIGNSYQTDNHSYKDDYRSGVLTKHEVSPLAAGDLSDITYDADRNILYLSFYFFDDTGWIYYFPEKGWSASWASYSPTEAPAGYDEELDLDYYRSLAPAICMEHPSWENSACTLCGYVCSHEKGIDTTTGGGAYYGEANCTHGAICEICDAEYTLPNPDNHKWDEGTVTTEPNCTEPGVKTFVCEHNSEHTKTEAVDPVAENHKWDEGTVTTEPNCTIPGTKTFVCEHNSTHTRTEPVDVLADAHKWDNGTVTTPPTCTEKGEKTLVCEHNVQHTKTEEIDSLGGHKYDHACDPDCNECGATRTPAAHYSENADGKCDECGESFKLSGGAIAGIATGSTVAAGAGGFSLFWFVIKKKKWSDLFVK